MDDNYNNNGLNNSNVNNSFNNNDINNDLNFDSSINNNGINDINNNTFNSSNVNGLSSDGQQKNKKFNFNKYKTFGFVAIIVVVVLILFFVFNNHSSSKFGGTSDGTTVNIGQFIKVRNQISDYDFKVNYVEENVTLESNIDSVKSKMFKKINVTIVNNDDIDANFSGAGFNKLYLENISGVKVGSCTMFDTMFYDLVGSIPDSIGANKTETGILYCALDNKTNEKVKLVLDVVSEIDKDAFLKNNQLKSTASEKYYVDLGN